MVITAVMAVVTAVITMIVDVYAYTQSQQIAILPPVSETLGERQA
jgi:hypothetical protein